MVYKKYITKRGKKFGPYYYESYRQGNTVKKIYIGDKKAYKEYLRNKKKVEQPNNASNNSLKTKTIARGFILLLLFLLIGFGFYNNSGFNNLDNITGFSINDPDNDPNKIEIINAEHLDKDRQLIGNIFDKVKAKDDYWSNIKDNEFVRVQFEQALTNKNDITVFARAASSGSVSGSLRISSRASSTGVVSSSIAPILPAASARFRRSRTP